MNPQVMATIRSTLLGVGGYGVASGLYSSSTLTTAVSGAVWAIGFGWSFWGHRKDGIIGAAAALSEVNAVLTTPQIANSPAFVADPKVVATPIPTL